MQCFQFAEPVPGEEPADALRTVVFMANFAAQDITGSLDASRGADELIDDLAHPAPDHETFLFGIAEDPVEGPVSDLGYPLIPSTGSASEPASLAWFVVDLPTRDNPNLVNVSIVLDVDLLPIGDDASPECASVCRFVLAECERIATSLGRSIIQVWMQHRADEQPALSEVYEEAGFSLAHSEVEFVTTLPRQPAGDVQVFSNEDFPDQMLEGIAELYCAASVEQPRGSLSTAPEQWDAQRLSAHTAHFRARGTENFHAIATDEAGEPIALSEVWIHQGSNAEVAIQGLTYVKPDYRRQGLGFAVKSAAMGATLKAHPSVRRIYTSVAPSNQAMLQLNRAFDARPVAAVAVFEKGL
ncbi:GNAT family N-acetyltransferase [Corynebacterium sp. H130]|uniref:GNAT family N-acetyltransferase n=1 Tax=Corynebacterium sp. H130 TaxID=3133444 RepID=UPI0030957A25